MNIRLTLVALLILIVLGSVLIYVSHQPLHKKATVSAQQVFASPLKGIAQIKLEKPGTPPREFLNRHGRWTFVSPLSAWASNTTVGSAVESLVSLKYAYRVKLQSQGSHSAAGLGLSPARATLQLVDTAGHKQTLLIGRQSANGRLYVQPADAGYAYAVGGSWYDSLAGSINALRSKDLLSPDESSFSRITLHGGSGEIVLVQRKNIWTLTAPVAVAANQGNVSNLVSSLTGLQADRFVGGSADLKLAGIKPPERYIELMPQTATTKAKAKPEPIRVSFGRFSDLTKKSLFCYSSANPGLCTLGAATVDPLFPTLLALRSRQVTKLTDAKPTAITVASAKQKVAAVLRAGKLVALTARADAAALSTLATDVMTLRAKKWLATTGQVAKGAMVIIVSYASNAGPTAKQAVAGIKLPAVAGPAVAVVKHLTLSLWKASINGVATWHGACVGTGAPIWVFQPHQSLVDAVQKALVLLPQPVKPAAKPAATQAK
ncbi:MAG: DUF4340 domain-containing protein [Phycisphaerales bacterium]|nr:DUF4340 domain-containing protein [Phycisphaerales bacterium]